MLAQKKEKISSTNKGTRTNISIHADVLLQFQKWLLQIAINITWIFYNFYILLLTLTTLHKIVTIGTNQPN